MGRNGQQMQFTTPETPLMRIPYLYSKGRGPSILIFCPCPPPEFISQISCSITNKNCSFLTEPSSREVLWPLVFGSCVPVRPYYLGASTVRSSGEAGAPPTRQAKMSQNDRCSPRCTGEKLLMALGQQEAILLFLANLTPWHQTLNPDTRSAVRGG